VTPAVKLLAVALISAGLLTVQKAQSQGGVPLWTNYYNGPLQGDDMGRAVAVDISGHVIVSGFSAAEVGD
jgi:hypothetical protein